MLGALDTKDPTFTKLSTDIALWRNLVEGERRFSTILDDRVAPEIMLPHLFSRTDKLLNNPAMRRQLISLDSEFIITYLLNDLSRVNKLFGNDVEIYLDFFKTLRSCLADSNATTWIRTIQLMNHLMEAPPLDSESFAKLQNRWVFMLLEILVLANTTKQAPSSEDLDVSAIFGMLSGLPSRFIQHVQREQRQLMEDFKEYKSNKYQIGLYILSLLKAFFSENDVNIRNADNDTPLNFLARIDSRQPHIYEFIEWLISRGADIYVENDKRDTPATLALSQPKHNDLYCVLFSIDTQVITAVEIEHLLHRELQLDTPSKINIAILLQKLASIETWSNFALITQGTSLWRDRKLIDLELLYSVARFIYLCHAPLATVLGDIIDANGNATYQIAACIVSEHQIKETQKNVMEFLANSPELCKQLESPEHLKLLYAVFSFRQPQAGINMANLCFNRTDTPITRAKTTKNLSFLNLVLRFAYKELSSKEKMILQDAILEVARHSANIQQLVNLEEYLVSKTDCLPGFHRSLLKKLRSEHPNASHAMPRITL